jgi:hypothetical protein
MSPLQILAVLLIGAGVVVGYMLTHRDRVSRGMVFGWLGVGVVIAALYALFLVALGAGLSQMHHY